MKGNRTTTGLPALVLVVSMIGFGAVTQVRAQRPYGVNDRQVEQLLRRVETRADEASKSIKDAYPDTERRGDVTRLLTDFEHATDQLLERFRERRSGTYDLEMVL